MAYGIFLKNDGIEEKLIGFVSCEFYNDDWFNIGYLLNRESLRQRYSSEAVTAVLDIY